MRSRTLLSWMVLGFAAAAQTGSAQPPQPAPAGCDACQCSLPLLRGCPDDYCRKPFPLVHCIWCCEPDDYCRKPYPWIWQMCHYCGPDDYDRNPMPCCCRPLCTSHYTSGNGCGTASDNQPCQDPSPSVKLPEGTYVPDQVRNRSVLPPSLGITRDVGVRSPYHPQ
jgi:hypothetical protein